MGPATYFVAGFTCLLVIVTYLLVRATNRYTQVTTRLLEQSEEAFRQSRRAFECDTISRIMFSATQAQLSGTMKQYTTGFIQGMLDALNRIDRSTYERVKDGLEAWREGRGGQVYEWMFQQTLGETKDQK